MTNIDKKNYLVDIQPRPRKRLTDLFITQWTKKDVESFCWCRIYLEAAPCNIALIEMPRVPKKVNNNGGTPEFCTITVTDGIAMGHEGMKSSLISREVIADSTELTVRGHCYDALIGIAGWISLYQV